jgi:hypothetical protein
MPDASSLSRLSTIQRTKWMSLPPCFRFHMKPLDVLVKPLSIDPPNTSPANFDPRKFARPHHRVDLRPTYRQIGGNLIEREKPRLYGWSLSNLFMFVGHGSELSH